MRPDTPPRRGGCEAVDLAEALETICEVLQEMRDNGELLESDGGWMMLIKSEDGFVLKTLPAL